MSRLNKAPQIQRLAQDLKLKASPDPVRTILGLCEQRVRTALKEFPSCTRPAKLLEVLAAKLQTRFEVAASDSDLLDIKNRYLHAGEKRFVTLEKEFPSDVFGITFRRLARQAWEPEYISVIDSRGAKGFRSNYTKWHEIGHLLVLTDQLRLSFSRTFCTQDFKDPEESLVDIIAGHFAFWPPLISKYAVGEVSFDRIEEVRREVCPEASRQSALLGIVKSWQSPCILLEARLGLRKKEQQLSQQHFSFRESPKPALRVSNVTISEAAAQEHLRVHRNWRVPEQSIISLAFSAGSEMEGVEDLSRWETSSGATLDPRKVRVQAKASGESVMALVSPV